jgi:predicted nucleic acid-binding protein
MRVVVDASVTIKWLLPEHPDETDGAQALALLDAVRNNHIQLVQPPHWLTEVGAVLARLDPVLAKPAVALLRAMEFPVKDEAEIYASGIDLAVELNHHLFDTLYHAVALTGFADTLITADLRYLRKARRKGAVCTLTDFVRNAEYN